MATPNATALVETKDILLTRSFKRLGVPRTEHRAPEARH